MRYHAMAKHYLYEYGVQAIPSPDAGEFLEAHREFKPHEFEFFLEALEKERQRYEQRLVAENVII